MKNSLEWLADRIFKNWKTTLIGLSLIILPLVFVFLGKATLSEAGSFIFVGFISTLLRDKKSTYSENTEKPPGRRWFD